MLYDDTSRTNQPSLMCYGANIITWMNIAKRGDDKWGGILWGINRVKDIVNLNNILVIANGYAKIGNDWSKVLMSLFLLGDGEAPAVLRSGASPFRLPESRSIRY